MKLRNWQQDALDQVKLSFNQGKKLFLTHATPGGGKTIHGLSVFKESQQTHLIILAPSTGLVNQWQDEAKLHYNIELKNGMLYQQQADFMEYQGIVMTYQAMNENHENLRLFCNYNSTLVIADEIHHVSDGQSWGDAFRNAFELSDHILALTGTPWTTEGKKISFVNYDNDGYAIPDFSYDKKSAIRDDVCRTVEFMPHEAKHLSFIDDITGELIAKYETFKDALDNEDDVKGVYRKTQSSLKHMKEIFIQADTQLNGLRKNGVIDAGGLLVAPDIKTAHMFQDALIMLTGEEYPIVHSKMKNPHSKIKEFRNSTQRWLISVDMITEGVDIKRLQVCIFLSVKTTELFFRQVTGRIERRRNHYETDRYAYFYYTHTDEIEAIVNRMIVENKAGEALREEQEEQEKIERGDREFIDDNISLEDLKTEMQGLIVNGFNFDQDIVIEAIQRRNRDARLLVLPVSHICLMIMNERDKLNEQDATSYQHTDAPIGEKKKRLRKVISKTINSKIFNAIQGTPTGEQIQKAHYNINKMVGLRGTDDSTSLDMLERKLEFITRSEVRSWL